MNSPNVGQAQPANSVGQAVPDGPTAKLTRTERRQAQPDLRSVSLLLAMTLASVASAGVRHVEDEENSGHVVIQMEVTPADEPSPVFEHRLTYGLHERLNGNRAQWYARAYPENYAAWSTWNKLSSDEKFDSYYQPGIPVDEVDWGKLDPDGRRMTQSLLDEHVVPGGIRRDCDWGIGAEQITGDDFFQLLLPEFQSARSFARMLNLQLRLAIHERRYDDAVKYLRTQYQLGADVGHEPIIVCGLIGVAITGIGNSGVTDLIAAPNSPNLYWALSEIPAVPVALGPAVRNELSIGQKYFGKIEELEAKKELPEEWNTHWKACVSKVFNEINSFAGRPSDFDFAVRATPLVTGLLGYSHAKQRLIEWGRTSDEVEAMAVGQVLSLYSSRVSQIGADKSWQAFIGPYSSKEFRNGVAANEYLRDNALLAGGKDRELIPSISSFLPGTQSARSAEMRVARDLAALRVIEALRMHAARNDGRWPDSLDEVTCVPVPLNPATDKPFLYHRDGATAVLELPESDGLPGYSRRYEITIAKP